MNDEVIVFAGRVARSAFVSFKRSVGDAEVVGIDVVFSVEFECGHKVTPLKKCHLVWVW